MKKVGMNTVLNTEQAINIKNSIHHGEFVYDIDTNLCYCKDESNKYNIVINEEYSPCLGSKCNKREMCYKYNITKSLSKEDFSFRDLSIEKCETDYFGLEPRFEICCDASNRYRHFRWNE